LFVAVRRQSIALEKAKQAVSFSVANL